ncbi:hypothetical protein N9B63_06525 [Akkermansiaceae bacterium]|jgi:hypothetical protein|nr:hypothetical protein [Akkermansiaceae bacterium]MDB4357830.1 hypothetical protein [bacterium]MDB4809186.1 hypothetical protein [bacterium]
MIDHSKIEKSALEHVDNFYPEPWEIPAVIALVLVAVIWLVRTHLRNQKLRHEGQELCRKSLENK